MVLLLPGDTDPQPVSTRSWWYRGVPPETIEVFVLQTPDLNFRYVADAGVFIWPYFVDHLIFSRGFRQMQGGGGNSILASGRSKAKNINDGDRRR